MKCKHVLSPNGVVVIQVSAATAAYECSFCKVENVVCAIREAAGF